MKEQKRRSEKINATRNDKIKPKKQYCALGNHSAVSLLIYRLLLRSHLSKKKTYQKHRSVDRRSVAHACAYLICVPFVFVISLYAVSSVRRTECQRNDREQRSANLRYILNVSAECDKTHATHKIINLLYGSTSFRLGPSLAAFRLYVFLLADAVCRCAASVCHTCIIMTADKAKHITD